MAELKEQKIKLEKKIRALKTELHEAKLEISKLSKLVESLRQNEA